MEFLKLAKSCTHMGLLLFSSLSSTACDGLNFSPLSVHAGFQALKSKPVFLKAQEFRLECMPRDHDQDGRPDISVVSNKTGKEVDYVLVGQNIRILSHLAQGEEVKTNYDCN
jgi:hypothetical protein